MDIRYSANQKDVKRYTTEELRKEFLIQNLYVPNEVVAVYSHVDRMVTMGCMPTGQSQSPGAHCGHSDYLGDCGRDIGLYAGLWI